MTNNLVKTLLLVVTLMVAAVGVAQVTGAVPFSSYERHSYDILNNSTLNLMLTVPVRSKAGIIPFDAKLVMNNLAAITYLQTGLALRVSNVGTFTASGHTTVCPQPENSQSTMLWQNFTYTDVSGATHRLPIQVEQVIGGAPGDTCEDDDQSSGTMGDSSGLSGAAALNADGTLNSFTVKDLAGNTYYSLAGSANTTHTLKSDRNGNSITIGSGGVLIDTTNQTALTTSTPGGGASDTYSYKDSSGNTQTVSVNYTNVTEQTNFGCSGYPDIAAHTVWLPTSVSYSDGSTLSIGYEAMVGDGHNPHYVTGRVSSITLPTGGTISYAYSGPNHGINCQDASPYTLTRTENGLTDSYTRTINTSTNVDTTVETLALGGTETYLAYHVNPAAYVYSDILKDSGGNVVSTLLTGFNGNAPGTSPLGFPVLSTDTYSYRGASTALTGSKRTTNTLDPYYGALTIDNKIYLPANSSTVYRETATTYGSYDRGCANSGPLPGNFPCTVMVTSGGSTISATRLYYDTNWNALSTSALVSGTTYQTQNSATYNSNGTIASSTDAFGATATNTVTDCNNTVASSTLLNGVTTSFAIDCNGSVLTSSTNANGTVSAQYVDPFYRPTQVTDQTNASATMRFSPTRIETQMPVNGTTITSYNSLDAFGHSVSKQTANGSAYDTMSSTFAGDYLASTSLPCSTSTLGGSCPITKFTYTYDTVGRLVTKTDATTSATTVTSYNTNDVMVTTSGGTSPSISRQQEVDGLGRLISVCEISSGTGSASCGQTNSATGYETTYQYNPANRLIQIKQFANGSTPQTRTFAYDLLGRKLTETTPEAGLVQFFYDTPPSSPGATCTGTYPYTGKLVKRYDARGNTTCYTYDAVGRLSSVVYSGPGSNGVNKYFVYDSATVNGQTMQHVTNRLAEAYTAASAGGTKVTDFGFSYNARGDKSDVYESTPNSGGYFHTTATYYENGALKTLGGLNQTPNTLDFSVDSLGRTNNIVEAGNCGGSCKTVLSSVNYNLGRVTGLNYGSGDYDTFAYSTTTGQETGFSLYVGNTATKPRLASTLSWFPTGRLQQQQFQDTINPLDSQTCIYGYDSLDRLSSVNCGSAWSQTFTYDPFGNIVKSGSSTFAATYNNSNQIATLGSNVPTYDVSGNLLTINTGTLHTYTWNAENRIASIDGKSLVYDAFDRAVEEGTNLQILYGPTGQLGTMSGQTTQRIYLGLPNGAEIIYDSSQSANPIVQHPDLMGNGVLGSDFTQAEVFSRFFAPYGEVYENAGTEVANFTGHFQDLDSNLYDTDNREVSPVQGRWLNPDPSSMSSVSLGDPQTLNRYAYVRGSAMGMSDPNGLRGAFGLAWWAGLFGTPPGADIYDNPAPGWFGGFTRFQVPSAQSPSSQGGALIATVSESETTTLPDGTQKTTNYPAEPPADAPGCGGPGVPCRAVQGPGSPVMGVIGHNSNDPSPEWASGEKYTYTVEDINGNPVAGVTVTEWYQDANSPGSAWAPQDTWSYAKGNCNGCLFQGSFTDFLGGGLNSPGYTYNQMFVVQVGGSGPTYLLTTQALQYASPGPAVKASANIIVP